MINPNVFLKIPVNYKKDKFLYPPSVSDVIKSKNFQSFKSILCISQEEIEDELVKQNDGAAPEHLYSPWEYIWLIYGRSQQIAKILEEGFEFFFHEAVTFLPSQQIILIGDVEEIVSENKKVEDLVYITEESYFDFQNKLREILGEKTLEPPNPDEDPRIKRMKAKARYRDRVKEKQGKGINFSTTLISLCCMNMGLNPLNIGELGYASVKPLVEMYQQKERYEIEVRSIQAGADPKKIKPKYWIKNLED